MLTVLSASLVLFPAVLAPQDPAATGRKPDRAPFALVQKARDGGRYSMLLRQFRAEEPDLPATKEAGLQAADLPVTAVQMVPTRSRDAVGMLLGA